MFKFILIVNHWMTPTKSIFVNGLSKTRFSLGKQENLTPPRFTRFCANAAPHRPYAYEKFYSDTVQTNISDITIPIKTPVKVVFLTNEQPPKNRPDPIQTPRGRVQHHSQTLRMLRSQVHQGIRFSRLNGRSQIPFLT